MADSTVVILITAKDNAEAKTISSTLLDKKLVACANIIENVESFFWWDQKIDNASEVLLILKSKSSKIEDIIKWTKSVHSYDVPEVIALPVIDGNSDYLKWVSESVR